MIKILTFCDYYLPGYKAGGPIQSLYQISQILKEEINFYFVTRDRDLGDKKSFPKVIPGKWMNVEDSKVYYSKHNFFRLIELTKILREIRYDAIYLNSFYSFYFSIFIVMLRYIGFIPNVPVLLAPRGEFSPNFLKQKSIKKASYIYLSRIFKIYDTVLWHASTKIEGEHIIMRFPYYGKKIFIAADISTNINQNSLDTRIEKKIHELKICFVSRIHKMKNLLGLIDILKLIPENMKIDFNIYGPIHDEQYWEKCNKELKLLKDNISWQYHGPIPQNHIFVVFQNHHLLLLPTFGENYGHVIIEALSAGCLVLISDNTPWNEINDFDFGKAINLNKKQEFVNYLIYLYKLNNSEMVIKSLNALKYSKSRINNSEIKLDYLNLFKKLQENLCVKF